MTRHMENSVHHFADRRRLRKSICTFAYLCTLFLVTAGIGIVPMHQAQALPHSSGQATMDGDWSHPAIKVRVNRWYEGGTLHRATYGQWSRATPRNQLATAADWAVKILGEPRVMQIGMDGLKVHATDLVTCINTAGTPQVRNHPVTELVAACSILMGM